MIFFNRVILKNVLLLDQRNDTLMHAEQINATLRTLNLSSKEIELSKIKLNHSLLRISIDTNGNTNIQRIIDALRSDQDTMGERWYFTVKDIEVKNSRFKLYDYSNIADVPYGINFSNMQVYNLDAVINDLELNTDTVNFIVKHARFVEKSGFAVAELSCKMSFHRSFMAYTDLYLRTLKSEIDAPKVGLYFNDYGDFASQGYWNKIRYDINLEPSTLNINDLGFFINDFYGIKDDVELAGMAYGKLNNLKGRNINLRYITYINFAGNFDLNGLPDLQETFMFFDIQNLSADIGRMRNIKIPGKAGQTIHISESLSKLGNIKFRGKFTGFINDFVTYGKFDTDLGQVSSDLSIRPDTAERVIFKGRLKTTGFDVGEMAGPTDILGKISMNGEVDGFSSPGGNLHLAMDGTISMLQFNHYDYHNIFLTGTLSNNTFDGSFAIEDPNLRMEFFGKIDASGTVPVFDFKANVDKARLYPLNITKVDPDYTISCFLNANFVGATLDDFDGQINLVNSLLQRSDKQIQIYDISLLAQHRTDTNRINLSSDLIDAELSGNYDFNMIVSNTISLLKHHFPALNLPLPQDNSQDTFNKFSFSINFKNTFPITDFFFPELNIEENSFISGVYDPLEYTVDITGEFPGLSYEGYELNDFHFNIGSNDSVARMITHASSMEIGQQLIFEILSVDLSSGKNQIEYKIDWHNLDNKLFEGNLSGYARFLKMEDHLKPVIELAFNPGSIVIADTTWNINQSIVYVDSTAIEVADFSIRHRYQNFYLDGKISEDPADVLHLAFNDFNLYNLNAAAKRIGIELGGVLDGSAEFSDFYENPVFLSDLQIDNLKVNNEILGNTTIRSYWVNDEKKINLEAASYRGQLKTLQVEGDYQPSTKEVDFDINLDKLQLNIIYPYLSAYVDELAGIASGNLSLTGTTKNPLMNGEVKFQKVSFIIDYLKTKYSFSNNVKIVNNYVLFNDLDIYDQQGNRALINGKITNDYLRNFYFDLAINAENFYFLDTRESDNELYYGRAIGTGIIYITGLPNDISFVISAKTEKNTELFINMSAGAEVSENTFISFTDSPEYEASQANNKDYIINRTGLNLDFDVEMTPEAIVQIVFDPKVGDVMKGTGYGNIKLEIDSYGKFLMFGDYQFEEGEYLFTLQKIINKRLKLQKGGKITWNGDPTDAIIDIRAYYPTKASPAMLISDAPNYLKKRYPVECHMIMTGNMLSPDIKFEIILPTAEEETKNIVRNAITTEEELTKQFLSLLVLNDFSSPQALTGSLTGATSTAGAGMAGVTTSSEFLSNQLSNWLSQISDDFDIGINYRPGDEISSDQVEVALSTQILDDRVTVHTNLEVGGTQTSGTSEGTNTSNIAGEFDVNVKLTNEGKLSVKAYNHSNDDQLYKSSQYTQGVGFVYREDFNTFGELFRHYWNALISAGKRKEKKKEQPDDEPTDPDLTKR